MTQEISPQDQEKFSFEKKVMQRFLDQFPEEQHHSIATFGGMEIISCAPGISGENSTHLREGFERIAQKLGVSADTIFSGLKIYIAPDVHGGGQALPRQNAVLLDSQKMQLTVGEMEDMLDQRGEYRIGDQSKLVGRENNATELGFVHELGHVLEFRAHNDMDIAFASLSHKDAPTEYGQKAAREDYAESWMYFIYDGPIDEERRRIIEADVASVMGMQH